MSSYPFLENDAAPGLVARIDQLHAEHSHRVFSAIALSIAAKVLYINGDTEDSRYIADMVVEAVTNTPEDEVRSMLTMTFDWLANRDLKDMPEEEQEHMLALAKQTVIDFKAGKFDAPDCD